MKIIKLKVPSILESLGFIEKALDSLKEEYEQNSGRKDFPLTQVRIATFEAFSNAVKHAHLNNPELEVIIQLTLETQKIEVQIFDYGKGFNFDRMKEFSQKQGALLLYNASLPYTPYMGLGIFIIISLMDEVFYIPTTDETACNRLVMIKYF